MTPINILKSTTHVVVCCVVLFLLSVTQGRSQCWNMVWNDEFDGSTLDATKWSYDLGDGCPTLCGWGNSEKEYYTNSTDNVNVTGGYLNITAKYAPGVSGTADFTSGKIHTRGKHDWLYGRFEARMKLPAGTGMWPAFWMLPAASEYGGWPTSGEIDIMEYRGDQTTKMNGTLHYGNASPNNRYDGTDYYLGAGTFSGSFHDFAVEWEPGEIRWYVDGVLFKTETETPNSLNPASNNAVTWPWNKDFYLILNLAVSGWYSGNHSTATIIGGDNNYARTMQVDYVRVYTDVSGGGFSGSISGPTSVLENESGLTYSINPTVSATYAWTVTGGTIVSGQGTNTINVDWTSANGSVAVVKTLSCGSMNYNIEVNVQPTHCGEIYEDFENIRHMSYGFINGVFTERVGNPSQSAQNTSDFVGRYIRNPAEQYDVLILDNFSVGDADDFEKGIKKIYMDVYSDGANRVIEVVLENSSVSSPTNYPLGRHSTYRATTSLTNSWETLEFAYINSPDGPLTGTDVDQLTILFRPNTNTNNTFYIDNLLVSNKPTTKTIIGTNTQCENETGEIYSVTSTTGSSYTWTVPSDAAITAGGTGPNNNSITVTFGVNSGNITVVETNTTGCSGSQATQAITVQDCTTGIIDPSEDILAMFPNPSSGVLTLESTRLKGEVEVTILDRLGKEVYMQVLDISSGKATLAVDSLSDGYYVLRIRDTENVYSKSFIKY